MFVNSIKPKLFNNIFSSNPYKGLNSLVTEDNDSNIAQLNLTLDEKGEKNISNNQNTNKNVLSESQKSNSRFKETKQMAIRVQLIIYLVKSIDINKDIYDVLLNFHKNFFYPYTIAICSNKNPNRLYTCEDFKFIIKGFVDLFYLLLEKAESHTRALEIFNELWNNKGLKVLSSKQKVKIFAYIFKILMEDFKNKNQNKTIEHLKEYIHTVPIVIEIISLTKDINKKVRNAAYDLIAEISEFMVECGIFNDWVKMLSAFLVSKDSFLISGVINTISRVFWQEKGEVKLLCQTAETIILLLKENISEITRSVFLFIRILVYIMGGSISNSIFDSQEENKLGADLAGAGESEVDWKKLS